MLTKALLIAITAHEGQVDKAGDPYIIHPFIVSSRMKTKDECVVALLHDVVEDTEVTLLDLLNKEIPLHIVVAVDAISKRKGETRKEYLKRVAENDLAYAVKLEDIKHNSDQKRLDKLDSKEAAYLSKKYKEALEILDRERASVIST